MGVLEVTQPALTDGIELADNGLQATATGAAGLLADLIPKRLPTTLGSWPVPLRLLAASATTDSSPKPHARITWRKPVNGWPAKYPSSLRDGGLVFLLCSNYKPEVSTRPGEVHEPIKTVPDITPIRRALDRDHSS